MENGGGLVEQPQVESERVENVPLENEGSMYGKFKDAISLLEAYKNLEAEFTRKSQRVSALEKKMEANLEVDASKESNALTSEKIEVGSSENVSVPEFAKEGWKQSVEEFFAINPDAREYKSRMSRILHENPEYASSPKCLEVAYKLAKAEGLKRPADIIKDQQFIEEYVLSDSRIKDIIITDYISSLARGGLPKVISGNSSSVIAPPKADAPRNIKEAGMLARKYLG